MITDTIVAIATPPGVGGIGIVRISGDDARTVAGRIFTVPLTESHKMVLGAVISEGRPVDEALGCLFRAPKSFTGEDVVELHCHGGIAVCRLVLEAALSAGAVMAEPGEFTKRAFLNGKLDLARAEAVGDLITAKTGDAVLAAAGQLEGKLSRRISLLRGKALDVCAQLLAELDFSDEVDELPYGQFTDSLREISEELDALLRTAEDGRMIRDGVNTAIVGAPNVGKSSFLNYVSGEDRAIVTEIPGTTRDILEVEVNLRGCRLNLSDTAGIRESGDPVERMGIERAVNAVKKSDLVLLLLDGSRALTPVDHEIIRLVRGRNVICLLSKADLPRAVTPPDFEHVLPVSVVTGEGFEALFSLIARRYAKGGLTKGVVVTSRRHKEALLRARDFITHATDSVSQGAPPDLVIGDLELCLGALGEIDGMTVSDEIVENIFANFCVGK